jgi:hypothetical protein
MIQRKPYPEFSWSLSRHKTLMDCSRKYGLNYYTSHNGWFQDSADIARQAYRLKNITNLPILFGEAIHEMIDELVKNYLKTGYMPPENQLVDFVRNKLNNAFINSLKNQDQWMLRPKHIKILHEIYYYGGLQEEQIQDIQARLEVCIRNFLNSKTFTDIKSKREMQLIEAEQFRTMEINGVKVYVVIDFLYRDIIDDKWIIVDWKTGKESDEDRNQLAFYALYLKDKFKVPVEKIEIRNEYLLTGNCQTYSLTDFDLESAIERIQMSLLEMGKYLIDEEENKPVEIDYFPKTTYENKCMRCNYLEMCSS